MSNKQSDASGSVPIVAIGASAGGLQQISALLEAIPTDTGAAYVVLQHLSSERKSQLSELLDRATELSVVTIEDGMRATADRVHVLPEDAEISIDGHVFHLHPKGRDPSPTVIDRFMRSLADACGPLACGIILSGSGNDGALGLKAIKLNGGLALVQDPESAEHPSMPRFAIDSAQPDYVLETAELVPPLCNHLKNNVTETSWSTSGNETAETRVDDAMLERTLELLRSTDNKRDFSTYKPNMLKRRIQRRMGLVGKRDNDEYIRLLQDDGKERLDLAQDFLISVTDFFRDAQAYAVLRDAAIPRILADREPNDTVRVWIPGCATGEEAYSIAIALDEAIRKDGKEHSFIVFASDIDERALELARIGVYPETIAEDLSAAQLRHYFDKTDDHYRVKRGLRERVVFAAQNILADPPYSRLDLISCRNLLMYLQAETQQRVIATFHFALKARGMLFLGSSETLSGQVDLFEPLDKTARLFMRIGTQRASRMELPFAPESKDRDARKNDEPDGAAKDANPERVARDILLREFVPAAVLINRKHEILCSYGATRDFLTLPFGTSSLSLVDMVQEEYRSRTRAVTHRAFRDETSAEAIVRAHDDEGHEVRIAARPLQRPESVRGLVFVTFERTAKTAANIQTTAPRTGDEQQLADELEATRSELNTTIQALEASNEDLKGAHEEVLSMNEELQSTNEELETSKEELQSVNEELVTVNTELENKVAELQSAHNDLQNLFSGTNIATLFLDKGLCIKRFTPAIKSLLNLIASDIGRPLSDISLKFEDPDLEADADRAMQNLVHTEKEVRAQNQRWYQRRVLPYQTQDNTIDGVVITFSDITDLKRASIETKESEQRLDLAMGAIRGGMWDMHLATNDEESSPDSVYLSARLKQLLGFEDDSFPNSLEAWEERVVECDREAFRDIKRRSASRSEGLDYRIRHRDGGIRWFTSYATVTRDEENQLARWIGIDRDITEHKLTDVHATQARARLQLLADAIPEMVAYVDTDETLQFVNQAFTEGFGYTPDEAARRTLSQVFDKAAYAAVKACVEAAMAGRSANCQVEHTIDGKPGKLNVNHVPQLMDGQTIGMYLLITQTETEGRRASDRIDSQSGLVYVQRMATIGEMASTLAHDIKQPLGAINNYAGALKRMAHAGRDPAEFTPILDKIADQVEHAGDMASLTRDFASERTNDDSEIDINTLVHRAVSLTEGLARKHNIEIHLDLHTPLPALKCMSIQIEQVIINLMVNAFDAMENVDRENRNLTLCTRPLDDHAVELKIKDTGEGIPGEKLGRIFDSFYTSKLDGTGLGLSLSKSIIESHGGSIWADSKLDDGATFYIQLPAGKAVEQD